jgi:hypothetical protein
MGKGADDGKKVDTVSHIGSKVFSYFIKRDEQMIKTSNSAKPLFVALVLGLLLSTTFISLTEAATIKNGVSCEKSGQTAKSGSNRYICGKNPDVSLSKLSWMLRECPQSYELFVESKEQYEIFREILASSGVEGQAEASKLLKVISVLESPLKSQVCNRDQ